MIAPTQQWVRDMTVEADDSSAQYSTNGTTGPFTVPFYFLANTHLRVVYTTAAGASTTLTLTTDYTVSGAGNPAGGSITTMAAYPNDGGKIAIARNVPLTQLTDYVAGDGFPADAHERALDKLTMIAQQLYEQGTRTLRVPEIGALSELPSAVDRAGKLLSFDSSGNPSATAPSAGTATALAADLLSSTSITKGTGQVGHGSQIEYPDGAGEAINASGRVVQGADNTGSTISTAVLRAHFDYCIPRGLRVVLQGNYLVDGPISNPANIASGALHIECVGDVTITVDSGAAAFETLLSCYTTAINSSTISGGRLTLNLSNKAATGILVRHAGGDGGTVNWGPVTVNSAKKIAVDTNENAGVIVYGRYTSVTLAGTIIDGVDRTAAGGACKGISISDVVGHVDIVAPQVSRVLCTGATADADGIAVFGRELSGVYGTRGGALAIYNPIITDCQGRSIKTQISQSVIYQPVINRQNVVAFSTSDIDHQVGGVHDIVGISFTYRKNGGTSPVPSTFIPVSLQHQCTDRTGRMRVVGGVLRTESAVERLCYVTVGAGALAGEVEIADVEVQALAGLSAPISRAVTEVDAGQVQASVGGLHMSVRGLRGDFSAAPLLGYTGASAANTSKLSFDIRDNENTGADSSASLVFANLSGTVITQVGGFRLAGNAGFGDFLGAWNFDYLALKAGCTFTYDRAASGSVTNGPVMTGAYPRVEVLGSISSGTRDIRIMEDTGAALVIRHRQSATWRSVT